MIVPRRDTKRTRYYALIIYIAISLTVTIVLIYIQNLGIDKYFPHLARFPTDFSPTYLQRQINFVGSMRGQTVFLGDSVLWGYRLPAEKTAVAILTAHGCACRNFAFKSGSPPNYYALMRLLTSSGIPPKTVVLDVNQQLLNSANAYYRTLHPAVAVLAGPLLTAAERALISAPPRLRDNFDTRLDNTVSHLSLLYAMRSDIRETLYGYGETPAELHPTPRLLEGTYDLSPLNDANVGIRFLEKTADMLKTARIPLVAFMTPTNHTLLHEYIDSPEYEANKIFLWRLLKQRGAHVIDLDTTFPANEFFDAVHLTAAGQERLASRLSSALKSRF